MNDITEGQGPGRRTVLKRTALIGGAMVWTTPIVQSIAAPALALGGSPGGGGNGEPSYVILFIQCGTSPSTYFQVKFERNDSNGTYTEECLGNGENGLSGDAANDTTCYNGYLTARNGLTYADTCGGADVSGVGVGDALQVTLGSNCKLVGWFLHDGTCNGDVTTGNGKCRWNGDANSVVDPVGPAVPTGSGGSFLFDKCV